MQDEELYLLATDEVEKGKKDNALWSKSMAMAEGDETKAKYKYIKLKVETYSKELKVFIENYVKNYSFYDSPPGLSVTHRILSEAEKKNRAKDAWFNLKKQGVEPTDWLRKYIFEKPNRLQEERERVEDGMKNEAEKFWKSLDF